MLGFYGGGLRAQYGPPCAGVDDNHVLTTYTSFRTIESLLLRVNLHRELNVAATLRAELEARDIGADERDEGHDGRA